jgi:hypothetical protein
VEDVHDPEIDEEKELDAVKDGVYEEVMDLLSVEVVVWEKDSVIDAERLDELEYDWLLRDEERVEVIDDEEDDVQCMVDELVLVNVSDDVSVALKVLENEWLRVIENDELWVSLRVGMLLW